MKLEFSKTAEIVVTSLSHWGAYGNLLAVLGASWAKPRLFATNAGPNNQPMADTAFVDGLDWANINILSPVMIQDAVDFARQQYNSKSWKTPQPVVAGQTNVSLQNAPRIGDWGALSTTAAQLLDYLMRVRFASTPMTGVLAANMGSSYVLGPHMWQPSWMPTVQSSDAYTVASMSSPQSESLARTLWYIDSPLHTINLIAVEQGDKEAGTIGVMQVNSRRTKRATLLAFLYRVQATLADLGMIWPWYVVLRESARAHGSPLAQEIDAVESVASVALSLRHPSWKMTHNVLSNMKANTPDGPAQVLVVSQDIANSVMRKDNQRDWVSVYSEMRDRTAKQSLPPVGPQGELLVGHEERIHRVDALAWLHSLKEFFITHGSELSSLATELWGGGSGGESGTLLFNEPPIAFTDGISSTCTASEAVFGLRAVMPITNHHMLWDLARVPWAWKNWSVLPVEREIAPGEYILPADSIPRDVIPMSLWMGEPMSMPRPAQSVLNYMKQVGMDAVAKRLPSRSGHPWPDLPGLMNWDPAKSSAVVKEYMGTFMSASSPQELTDSLEAMPPGGDVHPEQYMVRPDGFARRVAVQKIHPDNFRHMQQMSLKRDQSDKLWWQDWPVRDVNPDRPLTTGTTSIINSAFPSMSK